jgi:hypothetical protein
MLQFDVDFNSVDEKKRIVTHASLRNTNVDIGERCWLFDPLEGLSADGWVDEIDISNNIVYLGVVEGSYEDW